MGVGGIGIWQLVIILVIILLLFGTKKLRNLGTDLGGALKGFKSAMKDEEDKEKEGEGEESDEERDRLSQEKTGETFDVESEKVKDDEKR